MDVETLLYLYAFCYVIMEKKATITTADFGLLFRVLHDSQVGADLLVLSVSGSWRPEQFAAHDKIGWRESNADYCRHISEVGG